MKTVQDCVIILDYLQANMKEAIDSESEELPKAGSVPPIEQLSPCQSEKNLCVSVQSESNLLVNSNKVVNTRIDVNTLNEQLIPCQSEKKKRESAQSFKNGIMESNLLVNSNEVVNTRIDINNLHSVSSNKVATTHCEMSSNPSCDDKAQLVNSVVVVSRNVNIPRTNAENSSPYEKMQQSPIQVRGQNDIDIQGLVGKCPLPPTGLLDFSTEYIPENDPESSYYVPSNVITPSKTPDKN